MNSIDLKDNLKKFVKNVMWGEGGWCDNIDGTDLEAFLTDKIPGSIKIANHQCGIG